jgi:hypothetical protein
VQHHLLQPALAEKGQERWIALVIIYILVYVYVYLIFDILDGKGERVHAHFSESWKGAYHHYTTVVNSV